MDGDAPTPRPHQRQALSAVQDVWDRGGRRAWVVLPPGAGKTLVGLWVAAERLADPVDPVRRVVVLSPNTAIQGQWLDEAQRLVDAGALGATLSGSRSLEAGVTALTYQSLAVFDPDAESDDDGSATLVERLHDNGRELVRRLQAAGPLLLVLDECHHLLQVWGRLLEELLAGLPDARVLGLTATPPGVLTSSESALVETLFGPVVHQASIPALVREGQLAPFAELAWLVTPTPTELEWLAADGERFAELLAFLTDPTSGTIGFLSWLDLRFCHAAGTATTWNALSGAEPELCRAALRVHSAGLLARPPGARPGEADRVPPTAEDWLLLVEDWVQRHLRRTGDGADEAVLVRLRAALPGVGYALTRHGIRRGRPPVDRVLARTEAKAAATVQVVASERDTLGDRLRMLVLCDHERASATVPSVLADVLDARAGSAWAVLEALLADPGTAALAPLLVTGRTVAGDPSTLRLLAEQVRRRTPDLTLVVREEGPAAVLEGGWDSRRWVREVTELFEDGGCQVLVGTRGLLGEGWDARGVSGLVDLTTATTSTAVVQTRGRALRTDPAWPDKVAITWSVVALAPGHPQGHADWQRLVRKHTGFWGVDAAGQVVDGVAHLDPSFSPWAPPDAERLDALNASMVRRSQERAEVAARWQVGRPYRDELVHTVRVVPDARPLGTSTEPVPVVVEPAGRLVVRGGGGAGGQVSGWLLAGLGVVLAALPVLGAHPALLAAGLALLALGLVLQVRGQARRGRELVAAVRHPPSLQQIASAVADALHDCELVPVGAEAVRVVVEADGSHRCLLEGVDGEASRRFADALEEAVGPVLESRYLISRRSVGLDGVEGWREEVRVARGRPLPVLEVWHAVPAVLGRNVGQAEAYQRAWGRWVAEGELVATATPRGTGVLTAQLGNDPLAVTTLRRDAWE
ncbi:DEAD/DEAH box helicase family protein [Auraticoccus monumenti]|uniref:Type III restriction enzyme, res subunit n=1 Tax=Auraticoccus monumenti TaxID=675864 RepID=A0A1G7AT90_9ACTN|nr:DEAD/DEAH box helicase family protein [Auraticoccus monumenti]SDE18069.1 Type III restriction enzyme, res subunit [Auraticoccus monumenti]